jgi:hypothetical protein
MEIIVIKTHNELPAGVEMVLYEPPFYGEPLESAVAEFEKKYGTKPEFIYQIGKQLFLEKP